MNRRGFVMDQLHAIPAGSHRHTGDVSNLRKRKILSPSAQFLLLAFAALLLFPAGASAQLVGGENNAPGVVEGYVISVRELSIPSPAREAFLEGNRLLAKGDFSGSVAQFQRAIARFPAYYEAYFYLGVAEMKIHLHTDAEAAFRKAIELSDGAYPPAHFGLGLVLCERNNFDEAGATIGIGLYLDSESWSGYYAMARALFGMNRLEAAENSVREGIARKADLPEAYLLLADIHDREKNLPAVLDDLDRYIAIDPDGATRDRARNLREKMQGTLSPESDAAPQQP